MPSPETVWDGKVLTAVLNEYATIWQPQAAVRTVPAGAVTPGEGVRITGTRGQYSHLRISMKCDSPGGEADVAYTYFPGWYAYLEEGNVPVNVGPAKGGMIRLSGIPAGQHVVRLNFGNTPIRTMCQGVSVSGGDCAGGSRAEEAEGQARRETNGRSWIAASSACRMLVGHPALLLTTARARHVSPRPCERSRKSHSHPAVRRRSAAALQRFPVFQRHGRPRGPASPCSRRGCRWRPSSRSGGWPGRSRCSAGAAAG